MARSVIANQWLGRALMLIIIGLTVQLFCLTHITPASFLTFAGAGVGPVVLGFALIGYSALHERRSRDDNGGEP